MKKEKRSQEESQETSTEEVSKHKSIFDFGVDVVELRKKEMLEKYPWAREKIENAVGNSDNIRHVKKAKAEQLLNADRFLEAFSKQGSNMSFDQ